MSSKFLNGNLYLFSLLIMFWATQDEWHFTKAILIGLGCVLRVDRILQLSYVKSYFWHNLSKWEPISTQFLFQGNLTKHSVVTVPIWDGPFWRSYDCMQISFLTVWKYPQLFKIILWNTEDSCKHVIRVRRIGEKSYVFDAGKDVVKLNSALDLI